MNKKNMFLMLLALAVPAVGSAGVPNPDTSNPYSWDQWLVGGAVVGAGAGMLAYDFWQTVGADETIENGNTVLKAGDKIMALNYYVAALKKHEERWFRSHDGRIFRTKITETITGLLLDCNPESWAPDACPLVPFEAYPEKRAMAAILYALNVLLEPKGLPVFLNQDEHAVFGDGFTPFMQRSLYRFLSNAYGKCHDDVQRAMLQRVLCGLITRGIALEQVFDAIKVEKFRDTFVTDVVRSTVHIAMTQSTLVQQKCVALHMMKLWVEAGLPLRRAEYYLSSDLLSSPCQELRDAAIAVKEAITRNDTRSKWGRITDRIRNTLEYSGECCNKAIVAVAPLLAVAALAVLVGKGIAHRPAPCGVRLGRSCFSF